MKLKNIVAILLLCNTLPTFSQQVWTPDNGDGTFTNPIMWGDWPDPDVIRVGDDFYFVSTSMHYVPGCPIATSKDLVNWKMAGYAVERYDEDPRFDLKGGSLYLNGSWAASIRHHNGKFYVAFCTPNGWGIENGHLNHNPDNSKWSLTERPGYMRLKASLAKNLPNARNTLTQRVQGPSSHATVEMDVTGLKDSNTAGFGIFEFPYAYVAVKQENGMRKIIMCNDGKIIETAVGNYTKDKLWIRERATDKDFTTRFYYSTDGKEFHPIGNVLNMGLGLVWTANRFAMFNFSTEESGVDGYTDFNWFRFAGK